MTLSEARLIAEVVRQTDNAVFLAGLLSDAFPEFTWTVETAGPHILGVHVRTTVKAA